MALQDSRDNGLVPGTRWAPGWRFSAGIVAAAGIALAAIAIGQASDLSLLSPLLLAILLGMAVRIALAPVLAGLEPGLRLCSTHVLRVAVAMLGFQLTVGDVTAIGAAGIGLIIGAVLATLWFTRLAGRLLGVDPALAGLIAVGTSVCGASAVAAANHVLRSRPEDVAYAIGCVTVMGTVAMFLYPLVADGLGMGARQYGLWVGASLHEVGQVAASAFHYGLESGENGIVSKLFRVSMLAPVVLLLGHVASGWRWSAGPGDPQDRRGTIPWFVPAFVCAVLLSSMGVIGPDTRATLYTLSQFLLAMALGSLGTGIGCGMLLSRGWRPLVLSWVSWLFIAAFTLAGVVALG